MTQNIARHWKAELADFINHWGGVAGIVGAAVTLLSVIGLFWASGERDRDFRLRIANAHAEAARANEKAEEFGKEAALARLDTEKLRAHFAWRTLSQAQFDRLAESFRRLRPELEGKLGTWVYNEGEAASLADQINGAIKKAGYQSISSGGQSGGKVPFYGVRIDNRTFPKEAEHLREALADAGIAADLGPAEPLMAAGNQGLTLYVSVKAPPK